MFEKPRISNRRLDPEEFANIFGIFDENNNGEISKKELLNMMKYTKSYEDNSDLVKNLTEIGKV